MRRLLVVTTGLLMPIVLVVGSLAAFASVASAVTSAGALYRQSVAKAHRQTTVHFEVRSTSGGETDTTIGDAARNLGREQITIVDKGKTGRWDVRLVKQVAYLNGDETGLVDLGFTAAEAAKAAGKWVSIPKSNQGYKSVSGGVTFASALQSIVVKAPYKLGKTMRRGGEQVVDVHATFSRSGTTSPVQFFIGKADHLPEGYQISEVEKGVKMVGQVSLTKWSEKVSVPAPKGAITIASLGL